MFIGTNLANIPLQKKASNSAREVGANLWNNITNEYNDFKDSFTGKTENAYQQNFLDQQMQFNKEQAELNREFQREMSNTAYQRMAEDLKKAGYNPALVLGGGGSSTPSGSLATSSLATAPNVTASSTARYNNYVTSTEKTFNNLVTNAFNLFNTYTKTLGEIGSTLLKVFN